jgi:hypothetical protein
VLYSLSMGYYLGYIKRNSPSGKLRVYYFLRANVWDAREKRQRTHHLAYLGKKPEISLSRARALCERCGIPLETLKSVKGLKIVSDSERKEVTCDEKV